MSREDLTKKIKEGIKKSGFPLELKIGSILEKLDWGYSIGELYEDFETGKTRESDISASKQINGIDVKLFIECKKSADKQIVLYAPKSNKFLFLIESVVKLFPIPRLTGQNKAPINKIIEEFSFMRHFDTKIPFSQNLIVTKGNNVTEDNVNYLSSINGLLKKAAWSASDGYIETEYRSVFLYILIFDGALYQLSSSKTEEFDLKEIEYGQYKFRYNFKIDVETHGLGSDIANTAFKFGHQFIIEIMTPSEFEKYIDELESSFQNINVANLKGWGNPWPTIGRRRRSK